MSDMLVRLKPYNKKRGCIIRRTMIRGVRFDEAKGWYRVSESFAKHLATMHQDYYDEDSPAAFDIMDQAAAVDLEEKEAKAADKKAEASAPRATPNTARPSAGAMTTAALPGGSNDGDEDGDADPTPEPSRSSRRRRRSS